MGVLTTQVTSDAAFDARRKRMEGLAPMGRYAEPSEVAAAIVFLASPAASYITGECLNVTGGF